MYFTDLGTVTFLLLLLSFPLPDPSRALSQKSISRSFDMFELFAAILAVICDVHGGHEPIIIIVD